MPAYYGPDLLLNGSGMKFGVEQMDKIMFGSNQMWINNYAPDVPTNMVASSNQVDSVTITFTPAIDPGVPACTYDLYEDGSLVASGITSGYNRVIGSGIRSYYVQAINIAGSANSNTENGTSIAAAGSQTFTASGTFIVPIGYTSVTICMIGGGGGGCASNGHGNAGGGNGGTIVSQVVNSLTSGQNITVSIGSAGNRGAAVSFAGSQHGGTGGTTSFGAITASGGAGGIDGNSNTYAGNGGSRVSCAGTFYAGNRSGYLSWGSTLYGWGGIAGLGNGGNGLGNGAGGTASNGVSGGGGGGGASDAGAVYGGYGGSGKCIVSWS